MKSFRLPRLNFSFRFSRGRGQRQALTGGQVRFYLAALGLLILSFIAGLYLLFPTDVLRERVQREISANAQVPVTIQDLSLGFPPGLRGRGIVVELGGERPPLKINDVRIKPLWTTLLSSDPGMAFRAQLLGGQAEGTVRSRGEMQAQVSRIAFSEGLAPGSSLAISGTLSRGSFSGAFPTRPETGTRLQATLENVRLTGMEGLGVAGGTLNLGTITLEGTGRGNSFKVDQLSAAGGDLGVTGSGTLLLADTLPRSRINLNVELRPGSNFDPNLRDLLDLFARAGQDGSFRLRLSGTLASPMFTK